MGELFFLRPVVLCRVHALRLTNANVSSIMRARLAHMPSANSPVALMDAAPTQMSVLAIRNTSAPSATFVVSMASIGYVGVSYCAAIQNDARDYC